MYQFFALFTAYILLDIILINFWQVSAGILSHSYSTLSYNSIILFFGFFYLLSCFFWWFWSFSIEFRSGESLDHTIGIISLFWGHSWVNLQLCLESFSCWKMIFQAFTCNVQCYWVNSSPLSIYKYHHTLPCQFCMHIQVLPKTGSPISPIFLYQTWVSPIHSWELGLFAYFSILISAHFSSIYLS